MNSAWFAAARPSHRLVRNGWVPALVWQSNGTGWEGTGSSELLRRNHLVNQVDDPLCGLPVCAE